MVPKNLPRRTSIKNWRTKILTATLAAPFAPSSTILVIPILADERVHKWFAHAAVDPANVAAYKRNPADFRCQDTGGPCRNAGVDMVTAHKGRGVTGEALDAVVAELVATLDSSRIFRRRSRRAAPALLCWNNPVLLMSDARTVTLLLRDLAGGDQGALDRLVPLVYEELRRIAEGQLRRERPGHTLQPTALVHEVYVRMVGQEQPGYQDRAHFLAIAAHAMRRILIDHARERNAAKRGGGGQKLAIDEERDGSAERPSILIALDDALATLTAKDALLARLVEMRYFGGLTAEESSVALNLEITAVRRHLRLAEAWLQREMQHSTPGSKAAPSS